MKCFLFRPTTTTWFLTFQLPHGKLSLSPVLFHRQTMNVQFTIYPCITLILNLKELRFELAIIYNAEEFINMVSAVM